MKYTEVKNIPAHIFSNKECTKTPSPELREYLSYMVENHPNDLQYLFKYTQQYVKHGGCYTMTFEYWLDKLKKDI